MKSRFPIALSLALCAPPVLAQSTVTIYGLVSIGVAHVNNEGGARSLKLLSGANQNNRLGFRINEDLGNGNAAVAVLENGFDLDTGRMGQGGRMFGRQAWVGLSSTRYGAVTLGRQYDMFTDFLTPYLLAVAAGGLGNHPGDLDNSMGSWRYNNSIKYASPVMGGFNVSAMVAFGEAGQSSLNRAYSLGAGYRSGPLSLGLAYTRLDQPGTLNPAGAATDDYAGAPFLTYKTSPVNSSAGVARHTNIGAGGRYRFGDRLSWSVLITQAHLDYRDGAGLRTRNYDTSLSYSITPALSVAGGYVYTQGKFEGVASRPHWHTFQLGLDYALSRRTDVYLFDVFQRVSGHYATADIYLNAPSTSRTQNIVVAGLRHRF